MELLVMNAARPRLDTAVPFPFSYVRDERANRYGRLVVFGISVSCGVVHLFGRLIIRQ